MKKKIEIDDLNKKEIKNFETILSNIPVGIFRTTSKGKFLKVNRFMVDILNYDSEEEMLNIKVSELYCESSDRNNLIEILKNNNEVHGSEIKLKKKNGDMIWVKLTEKIAGYIDDKSFIIDGIIEDITIRKQSELQLARMATLVDQAADSIVLTDTKGNIEYVNRFFEINTGYSFDEAIGKNPRILKSPAAKYPKKYFEYLWETISSGEVWQGEFTNRKKNGEDFIEEATIFPVKLDNDEIIGYGAIKKDITLRVEMEQELESAYNEMEIQKNRAEEAVKFKSVFLANMSHDMRTPLNAINGFADLMTGTDTNDKQKKYVSNIKKSGKILENLINDILDVSKIEAGKIKLNIQQYEVDDLIENISSLFDHLFSEKAVRFEIKKRETVPKTVYGDMRRIQQILGNFLSNSLKFTIEGSVTLDIDYISESEVIKFSVTDTGIGIEEDSKQRIFDPFFSDKNSLMINSSGTGLGLVISKNLAELMGGEISFESGFGKGSKFSVTLPANRTEVIEYKLSDKKNSINREDIDKYLNRRIVVAEDDIFNRELLNEALRMRGFNFVKLVNDGKELLHQIDFYNPDIIIMDNKMPELSGMEAAIELRKKKVKIPIILLTADLKFENGDDLSDIIDSLMSKPIDFELLFSEMYRLFESAESNSESEMIKQRDTDRIPKKDNLFGKAFNVLLEDLSEKRSFLNKVISRDKISEENEMIARIAHTLKGNAGYFSLTELETVSRNLDAAYKRGASLSEIKALVEGLRDKIEDVIENRKDL